MDLALITKEVDSSIKDPQVQQALMTTVFKKLTLPVMKQAIVEGMIRGFKFKDFLDKNIYAIPFGDAYSLVTSIDYSRKVAQANGIVGKDEPVYEMEGENIISCSVTVKKRNKDGYVGDFTAKVYFKEYTTGANLWAKKPRTMIAKVAEMHALRMACPAELSHAYVEEEMSKGGKETTTFDTAPHREKLDMATSLDELGKVWSSMPIQAKQELEAYKDEVKAKFSATPTTAPIKATAEKVEVSEVTVEPLESVQILSEEEMEGIK